MMSENRKYKGSFWIAAIRVIVYGILIGFVLGIIVYIRWPEIFFLGFPVSAGIVFLRRTVVELEGNKICIHGTGHKECFDIRQFAYPSVRRKTYIGSYSKYTDVECYLIFALPEGYKRFRLYGFGERDLERVLEAIRSAQAGYLTEEEKAAIAREYEDEVFEALAEGRKGYNEFSLPASVLIKKERKCLKKISLIMLGIILIAGIMDTYEIFVKNTFSFQLLFLTMLALLLLIFLTVTYAGLGRKKRICAERIIIDGDRLRIGEKCYSYASIEKLQLTSPRRRSDSIFPVQRYMRVSAGGGTEKYWLGSEASFGSYEELCQSLERGMVLTPNKLKFM